MVQVAIGLVLLILVTKCSAAVDYKSNPYIANSNCSKIDQQSSFNCECIQGYEFDGHKCKAVMDPCKLNNICHAKARCISDIHQRGFYQCECIQGYEGDGHKCTALDTANGIIYIEFNGNATVKNTTLFYNRPFTIVINRTSEKVHNISNIKCHYAENNFLDFTKNPNGTWDQQKHVYTVQEDKATNSMNSNWKCVITYFITSTIKKHCKFDLTKVNVKNSDVDECNVTRNPCSPNANCTNTLGSYKCTCHSGYDGNGTYCQDVNECLSYPCPEHAQCLNEVAGYRCKFRSGFTGDAHTSSENPTDESLTNSQELVPVSQKEVESSCAGTATVVIAIIVTMVLASILSSVISILLVQRRFKKARVVDQGLPNPNLDESFYEIVDSPNDAPPRKAYPLPAEELEENKKYVHYDTPYEWRIWRFGVNPNRRAQRQNRDD